VCVCVNEMLFVVTVYNDESLSSYSKLRLQH